MAVSRRILLDGLPCLDPLPLDTSQRDGSPNDFVGRANGVTCPLGARPGTATVVVPRTTGDGLDRDSAHTISFIHENGTTVFSGYYIKEMYLSNVDGDLKSAYVVELVDKRHILTRAAINQRYNVHKPIHHHTADARGRSKYWLDSLSGSSLQTWAQVWASIWGCLGATAGALPALPYTPAGTPKNYVFDGNAWEAAIEFLASIVCTIGFDPISDSFYVVQLGTAQAGLDLAVLESRRIYDGKMPACDAANSPASWLFMFPRQYPSNDDHTEYGQSDTGSGGPGLGEVGWWDRTPATFCEIGGIQNQSDLDARKDDLEQQLSGKAELVGQAKRILYSGVVSSVLPGSQLAEIRWRDYGDADGMVTELHHYALDLPTPPRQGMEIDKVARFQLYDRLNNGGSAVAIVVVYDWGSGLWETDTCGVTLYDSLEMAPFDIGVPAGVRVWGKWNYDSEKWELLSLSEGIVFFQLYEDKILTVNPTQCEFLTWTGAAWVPSGVLFNLYDDYYAAPGFFTGTAGIDRGWARLRKKNVTPPHDYELIWMSGPCHEVRFALLQDRDSSAPFEALDALVLKSYRYGNQAKAMEGGTIELQMPASYFPFAKEGAKGTAEWNDRTLRYVAVQCDQLCLTAHGFLAADLCGADSTSYVSDFTNDSQWPFSQSPAETPGQSPNDPPLGVHVFNFYNHRGKAGDLVQLIFWQSIEEYVIVDIEKRTILVGGKLFDDGENLVQDTCESETCDDSSGGSG